MGALRPLARQALRPHLSLRYQHLRRHESSLTQNAQSQTPPTPSYTPSFLRRYRAPIIWSVLSIGIGFALGSLAIHTVAPPHMPQPGTHEDNILIADLNKRIDSEFRVKILRGKCLAIPKMLKGQEGGWVEIVPAGTIEQANDQDVGIPHQLPFHDRLVDALQGAKGLGVERIFYERGAQKLVAVVWFGGAMSGWPGVVHGGLLATAVTEKIALAAHLAGGGDSNAQNAVQPQRMPGTGNHATLAAPPAAKVEEPCQLSVDYAKPTYANNFHVIRVSPSWSTEDDVRLKIQGHEWIAELETMNGKLCVKATAKFEPRSRLERAEEKVLEKMTGWGSYKDFKDWMWPSRQELSLSG